MNRATTLLLLLGASTGTLAAQTLGLPVIYRPVVQGVGTAFDVGGDKNGVRAIAVTGVFALGHIMADSSRLALFDVSGSAANLFGEQGQAGGTAVGAELSLLGSFGVGVDRSKWAGVTRTYVPLAAALPVYGCADRRRIFEFYAVPLWGFERVTQPAGSYWLNSWASFSAGLFLEYRSGWGLQLGVGGIARRQTSDPYHRVTVSIGLHFSPHSIVKGSPAPTARNCSFILGEEG